MIRGGWRGISLIIGAWRGNTSIIMLGNSMELLIKKREAEVRRDGGTKGRREGEGGRTR